MSITLTIGAGRVRVTGNVQFELKGQGANRQLLLSPRPAQYQPGDSVDYTVIVKRRVYTGRFQRSDRDPAPPAVRIARLWAIRIGGGVCLGVAAGATVFGDIQLAVGTLAFGLLFAILHQNEMVMFPDWTHKN